MKNAARRPDELEELAIAAFNEHTLAGLAVGVVRDGALERFVGLGLADAHARRPVDPTTVFRIGSISKTMTAIAVMQLVEEGRLGLDDPIGEHLRSARLEPPRGAAPVTARHLLTHRAGIGEIRAWRDLAQPVIGLAAKAGEPPPDLADYYRRGVRTEVAPGAKWAYANHGFGPLGLLVQDLHGAPFAGAMRERIFDPLGMEHTDFVRSDRVRDRLAVGYALRRRGRLKPVKDLEVAVGPAGSCFSSTEDMARYLAALLGGGEPLVRRETLEQMLAPPPGHAGGLPHMGLSFFVELIAGRRVAGHDGGWAGFISAMLFAPDDGAGVRARSPLRPLRRSVRLRSADPDDPLVFEARHGDVRIPLAFERGADGRVEALHAATALGGFARLRRRPRATSVRLWGRVAGAATAGAAAAAALRQRRRRGDPPPLLRRRGSGGAAARRCTSGRRPTGSRRGRCSSARRPRRRA